MVLASASMVGGGLALFLALGQLPTPELAEPGDKVEVEARSAEYDAASRLVQAEGEVRLRTGGIGLTSETLRLALDEQVLTAAGNVTFVDGGVVVFAREGRFSLSGEHLFEIQGGEVLVKTRAAPGLLERVGDQQALRRTGRNAFVLRAETIRRTDSRRFLAEDLQFTPCDCPGREPDWAIVASSADIEPEERALLAFPRVYVRGVPVLVLPALYVPLANRRTGLLIPRPGYSRQNGFTIEQPLFIEFGESYDATLTAGYFFGVEEPETPGRVGAKGPRGSAEFRYVPSEHTRGRIFTSLLYDLHHDTDAGAYLPEARGVRGELSWRHSTLLPNGFAAHADVNLVSDGFYLNDAAVDVIRDAPPYLRSQAWLGWRGADVLAFSGAQYYQDLTVDTPTRTLFGRGAPTTMQRLPVLGLHLPQRVLLGPLRGGLEAYAVRYQPVAPFAGGSSLDAPPAQTRLNLNPTVALDLLTSGPVYAGLYGSARGDVRSAFQDQQTELRGYAIAGAWASTAVSRLYGSGPTAMRHSIEPRLELRGGSPIWSSGGTVSGPRVLDELDMPAPPLGFGQGVASVVNRLTTRSGAWAGDLARLELGQGFDFGTLQAADAFARLDTNWRFLGLSGEARYDVTHRTFASTNATARLDNFRGDMVFVSFERLLSAATARMRTGIDTLFGWPPPLERTGRLPEGSFNQASAGFSFKPIEQISLRYSTTARLNLFRQDRLVPNDQETEDTINILQHTAGITVTTACDCWSLDLYGVYTPGYFPPSIGFSLDLKNLGTFGAAR